MSTYRTSIDQQRDNTPDYRAHSLQINRHRDIHPPVSLLGVGHGNRPHRDEYKTRRYPNTHACKDRKAAFAGMIEIHQAAHVDNVPNNT